MTIRGALLDGRYRLIAPIAAGGMSTVWRGHDDVLARPVAVKVLTTGGPDATFVERVRHEAMAIARISHPYIANVYDYGESTGPGGTCVPYIVMELVEGESLARVLRRGRLSWPTAAGICAQVAAALAAAHQLGVVHRDVTPANVMLCVDGVKIVDFGICATAGQGADPQVYGTPAYLAPERLGGGPAEAATDVYGLGLLLYETITGHLPWPAATTTQLLSAHCYQPPAPMPAIAGMPERIGALCARSLAVDPARRPTSAQICVELAAMARAGDPRARPALQGATTAVAETRARGGTRVMPHGATHPVDPDSATASIAPVAHGVARVVPAIPPAVQREQRRPRQPRPHRIFLMPALLMVMLFGGVGWAQMHQANTLTPTPAHTPATPGAAGAVPKHAAPARDTPVATACSVRYGYTSRWVMGFAGQITFSDRGSAAMAGWVLTFDLPSGEHVAAGWNGEWDQDGDVVTVRDLPSHVPVPAGGQITVGFLGTSEHGISGVPSHFRLNGLACTSG